MLPCPSRCSLSGSLSVLLTACACHVLSTYASEYTSRTSSRQLAAEQNSGADVSPDASIGDRKPPAHYALAAAWNEAIITGFTFVVVLCIDRLLKGDLRPIPRRSSSEAVAAQAKTEMHDTGPLAAPAPAAEAVSSTCAASAVSPCGAMEHEATEALAAAVRRGKASELPALLERARSRAAACVPGANVASVESQVSRQLLTALRACASRRRFREGLDAYDHVASHIGVSCSAVWSLLLYSAVEAGQHHRCTAFFDRLVGLTIPSGNDFVNMVRCMARCGDDVASFEALLQKLRGKSFTIDALSRNRALAACTGSGALELVEAVLASNVCKEPMDIVAYNTLMKGYALAGKCPRCFELYSEVRTNGLVPSEMTFGILLDACNTAKEFALARRVFQDLLDSGLRPNVVHYTTLMKGLVHAGHLQDAAGVLHCMLQSPETAPDVVTYSMLVQAHADRGNVAEALQVLKQMLQHGIKPDDIILNIVLSGCCVSPLEADKVFKVFRWLVQHGLQPSTATLSILLKALAKSEAWDAALRFLRDAPKRLGTLPEARLYTQLAWACAQAGRGQHALEAYSVMVETAARHGKELDRNHHARMVRICASCDECAGAQEICYRATGVELPIPTEEAAAHVKPSAQKQS